ncbi:S8 family peptidase [Paraglaciecola psychrophila]|uniref:Peptidase S8/S53 subtilisin kexin sedolisin n=1 Tax=Paraglaciecola psychrophila 170 TaxID=1129794 RepID=K7ACL1_9ALTE|nr:S8 family serine peptidase [Paraglaciecola psychrophila]AGH43354.1 peptidase S8/S53 subtilisin kexin sedolisin [Paraglaciecola psychrophila 170]GAC38393.1 peptidase S8/S53 subtilisin kexin sedolisin [Paraglaciecola psychrophila 170]
MKKFTLSVLAAAVISVTLPSQVLAQAAIGEQLAQVLPTMSGEETIMAVVTFEQMSPVSVSQIRSLKALGIVKGVQFSAVPVMGLVANVAQIEAIAARDDVRSVWLNRKLDYFNASSRQITGVDKIQGAEFANRNGGTEYTGKGVTIMVNDSGIDATHQDLFFGDVVVDNVQAATHSLDLAETGITDGFVIQGQPNTDLNVGHGTHCAGTIAGSGVMSDGKYKGVAPDADLVGYGSGAGLFILDAVGGYDYAINHVYDYEHPLRVMSNSWGSGGKFDPKGPVNLASYKAYKFGILSVFAAGNAGSGENTHNPYAQIPWGMSVGAGDTNGNLVNFSSRGLEYETGDFTMPDGTDWTYKNEVTIVAPGRYVISTRSSTNMVANGNQADSVIEPAYLPFYTRISGTSMATPHAAGVVALVMEANPSLNIDEVKQLIKESATNMPGYEAWEVGAGYINARAAVAAAKGFDNNQKETINNSSDSEFFANIDMQAQKISEGKLAFDTVESQVIELEVGPNAKFVSVGVTALAAIKAILEDPDGNRYEGDFTAPLLADSSVITAPAKSGTWKLSMQPDAFGLEVSPLGVAYDEQAQTDEASDNRVTYWAWQDVYQGSDGMDDVIGHSQQDAIENAVLERLMDGRPTGQFEPDSMLSRKELAKALVMGAAVRQHRSLDNEPEIMITGVGNRYRTYAESVIVPGAALKDAKQQFGPVMMADGGDFRGGDAVKRAELAYSLVQVIGKAQIAMDFGDDHQVTVNYNGQTITIADQGTIPSDMRGYVQVALDEELLGASYNITQEQFGLEPKIGANFNPDNGITRAGYAIIANKIDSLYFVSGTASNAE